MGPMLATEGKLDQNAAHTASRQCAKGTGVGAGIQRLEAGERGSGRVVVQ
jgi:hypothetical protein